MAQDGTRGERMRMNYSLTSRERRSWAKRIMDAQDEIDAAEDKRNKIMKDAYDAGVSFAFLESSSGFGPHTVRKIVSGDTGGDQEDQQDGS